MDLLFRGIETDHVLTLRAAEEDAHGQPPLLEAGAGLGPIFLHPSDCPRYEAPHPPGWFAYLDPAVVRG